MKTDKGRDVLMFENVLGQLRHAYALAYYDEQTWTPAQRRKFADGLLGPQIERLEALALTYARQEKDLATACQVAVRHRRQLRDAQERLLAHANDIGSASQARRIIFTVFSDVEQQ